jgi:hypothetical protein
MAPFDTVAGATATSFSDTTLSQGDTVTYMVTATNNIGTAADSNIPPGVTTPSIPDAITDLALTVVSPTQVDLSWSLPNDNGSPITEFNISL